jgi:hypothetical protein
MGPLGWPHKREKIKQNLTKDPEMGPYLVARKARRSALMGPLESLLSVYTAQQLSYEQMLRYIKYSSSFCG